MMGFTTKQVGMLTGLTFRQLNYFDNNSVLSPSVQPAQGRGTYRLYSFRDLVGLRMIAKLRHQGISLQAIRKAVTYLEKLETSQWSACVLALQGDDVVWVTPDQSAVSLLRHPGQLCFLIDVGRIKAEVESAIQAVG